jgi:uncharacterized delta-60 repeat protein
MAITVINDSLGIGQSTTSSTTVVITTNATVPVGDFIVVNVASDNLSATTPTFTATDSAGNTYTTQVQGARNASANAGVAGAIITAPVTTELASGGTITVTCSGAVVNQAAQASSYRGVGGLRGIVNIANGASTTASVTSNGSALTGDLVLGAAAIESRGSITFDSDTVNGNWSAGHNTISGGGGADASKVQIVDQYKIVTGDGAQTFNLTNANTDWVAMIVAFVPRAVPAPPTTTLTPGDQFVDVAWTDPTDLGAGTSILLRQYTTDGGATWAAVPTAGGVDDRFNTGGTIGANNEVRAVAIQSDGKIIIGGDFTTARGTTQNRIARLNTDGTLDTGFNTGGTVGVSAAVLAVAVQSDGKIIIGGNFTTARGTTQNYIARLNTDGTLDTGFNTGGTVGADNPVYAVAVQSDGKIIIGGTFITARGTTQNRIARLNTDGTLDTGFNTGGTIGADGGVYAVAVQSDGKIIIGGFFTTARGTTQNRIARLNTDGTLDTGFNTGGTIGVSAFVSAIAIQSDGKIIIGGFFTTARGTTQNYIARLNTDGTLDTGFNTGGTIGVDSEVRAVAVQSDGKIIIGGTFITARGTTQNYIARLNTDGTLDTGFNTGGTIGVSATVRAVAVQPNGKIIIGGFFTTARGITQNRIARLFAESWRITETSD